jgi:hypothetical protein
MKDLIKLICAILFVSSCTTIPKEIITSHITILDSVDFAKLDLDTFFLRQDLKQGIFNSVRLDLVNNTDSVQYYWTESCSWQANCIPDNKSITWYVMCPKNVPVLINLPPHYTKSYFGIIEYKDSTIFDGRKFKIGFVFIRKNEVRSDLDYNPILDDKIKNRKDIIWSNSITPGTIKLSITRTV